MTFLYEELSSQIINWIQSGTLQVGEKLPSIRRMSVQQQVSLSTVMEAYARLETQGWINSRPQSGYYVKTNRLKFLPEPKQIVPQSSIHEVGTDEFISQYLAAYRKEGELILLGSSNLPSQLLPTTKLYGILAKICRETQSNVYEDSLGDPLLRREIAKLAIQSGAQITPEEVLITCGCTESLSLALRAIAGPGDIIAVESPTYFGTLQTIEGLGMRILEVATHPRTGLQVDHLRSLLKEHPIKACLTIPTFHNPLGVSMPDQAKKELVELLTAHQIPLIEDDIFGEFYFGQERPRTLKSYDQEGLVLLCSSVSKTMAPGFRIGWIAPGRYWERVTSLKRMSTHSTVFLPQKACAEFLTSGGFDRHMKKVRRILEQQLSQVTQAITEYFPEGIKLTRPTGGSVLWLELPETVNALKLYEQASKHKIIIAPGPIFSVKKAYQNYIRLSFGQEWSKEIDHAFYLLGTLIREQLN